MRQISDRIGESVSGMPEIHAHDTSAWHLADISHRYGDIYDIRFEIFQRKFFIKFLNNFINQLTPFFFYSIGGYLVIKGSISFGCWSPCWRPTRIWPDRGRSCSTITR